MNSEQNPASSDDDCAVSVLRLPIHAARKQTAERHAAFVRLLRWTLITQGFLGFDHAIRVDTVDHIPGLYKVEIRGGDAAMELRTDYRRGFCMTSISSSRCSAGAFDSAVRIVEWLIAQGYAQRVTSVVAPRQLLTDESPRAISSRVSADAVGRAELGALLRHRQEAPASPRLH